MRGFKRKDALPALLFASTLILALLAVFAIKIANNQASSRADVRARVHERAVLAGALIDGLFGSVTQQGATYARQYGARTVSTADMNRRRSTNAYTVLLDASGAIIATSRGVTPDVRARMHDDISLQMLRAHRLYGLGDLAPYPGGGVLNFAVSFPTSFGVRTLVSGFRPAALGGFLASDLKEIPGVKGAENLIMDGRGAILASTDKALPPGKSFDGPVPRASVSSFTADSHGQFFSEVRLANSNWLIVLRSPDGPLYASVSGIHEWLPWVIFAAFAIVALIALVLVRGVVAAGTRARQAGERLEVLNRELEASNDMLERRATELARSNAELDQFASIASHDLQEPLRKVRTFTEQLTVMDGANLSDKGRDYLRRANAAAERMQVLIEDLLKFSRVATHARPFTEVDLGQVVTEVLDDLSDQVERSGAVVRVGELPRIAADPLQIRQLMQNLISNALKFQKPDVPPEVTINPGQDEDGSEIVFTVTDNGIGFDPRYNTRIFRVFERLHGRSEYSGTGIGLALCRKIVERHGGTIAADSVPGVGSTFTVRMPATPPTFISPLSPLHELSEVREEAHVGT